MARTTTLADIFADDPPKPPDRCYYCGSYSVAAGAYRCDPPCPAAIAARADRERIADAVEASCLTCGGTKEIDCPMCNGEEDDCEECDGNGQIECPDAPEGCGGTGKASE